MIKKADIFLLIVLILIGCFSGLNSIGQFLGLIPCEALSSAKVVVSLDGKLYGTYDLSKDQTVSITRGNDINNIIIKNKKVQMTFSNCKNQYCVKEGSISMVNDTLVCLPHKLIVEIKNDEKAKIGGDVDVISG